LASSARIEQTVKAYTDKIREIEARVTGTEDGIRDLGKKMEKMDEKISKKEENVDKKIQKGEKGILEEMREREVRRMNLMIYRVPELDDDRATGMERIEFDKKQCSKIFHAIEVRLKEDDIKFCRRVGERGEESRPLLVGLYSEADKEDKAKNLRWAVVGARGEKRLIKTTARDNSNRQDGHQRRGGARGRGGGRTRGEASGGWEEPRQRRERSKPMEESTGMGRDNRRRMRSEDSEDSEDRSPPRKR